MKYTPIYPSDLQVGDNFVENTDIQDQKICEVTAVWEGECKIQYKSPLGQIYYLEYYSPKFVYLVEI